MQLVWHIVVQYSSFWSLPTADSARQLYIVRSCRGLLSLRTFYSAFDGCSLMSFRTSMAHERLVCRPLYTSLASWRMFKDQQRTVTSSGYFPHLGIIDNYPCTLGTKRGLVRVLSLAPSPVQCVSCVPCHRLVLFLRPYFHSFRFQARGQYLLMNCNGM